MNFEEKKKYLITLIESSVLFSVSPDKKKAFIEQINSIEQSEQSLRIIDFFINLLKEEKEVSSSTV